MHLLLGTVFPGNFWRNFLSHFLAEHFTYDSFIRMNKNTSQGQICQIIFLHPFFLLATRWLLVGLPDSFGGLVRSFPISVSFHHGLPCSCITWEITIHPCTSKIGSKTQNICPFLNLSNVLDMCKLTVSTVRNFLTHRSVGTFIDEEVPEKLFDQDGVSWVRNRFDLPLKRILLRMELHTVERIFIVLETGYELRSVVFVDR
jgi:hypothetical protein